MKIISKSTIILTSILITVVVAIYYIFFYSPYLRGLSSSEEKLYQTLKTTKNMQTLKGKEAETSLRLFLHSIEEEDWNVSALFYDRTGDGTIDTAFGPKEATPDVLKTYRRMFIGNKSPFVQNGGKRSAVGYITLKDPMSVALGRWDNIWYIRAFYEQ